ncbi:hypothetical protein Syun_021427 [Stephania yunnanensis]|uniref:Uncharacterized protein n=1 Tax=Stephania yunnanensis TaxID=152371 RepID=A0AAP0IGD1_9MAGN
MLSSKASKHITHTSSSPPQSLEYLAFFMCSIVQWNTGSAVISEKTELEASKTRNLKSAALCLNEG